MKRTSTAYLSSSILILFLFLLLFVTVSENKILSKEGGSPSDSFDTPLEITMWTHEAGLTSLEQSYVDLYNSTHTYAQIRVVSRPDEVDSDTMAALMSKTAPDILILSDTEAQTYAHLGTLIPLDEYISLNPDMENISPELFERYLINGQYYGIPCGEYAMGLLYNKKLFEKADITPPESWTWEEFLETAAFLTDHDTGQYGFALNWNQWGNWWFQIFAWAGGDDLTARTSDGELVPTFTSDGVLNAAEFYRTLKNSGCIQPEFTKKLDELKNDFSQGKAAMIYSGLDDLNSFTSGGLDIKDIGILPIPAGPSGTNATQLGGSCYVITTTVLPEKRQAVFDYYSLVSSKQSYEEKLAFYQKQNAFYLGGEIRIDVDYDSGVPDEFLDMLSVYKQNGRYPFYGSPILTSFVDNAIQQIMIDDSSSIYDTFSYYEKQAIQQAVKHYNESLNIY